MSEKLYLTIDSSGLDIDSPVSVTVPLENYVSENYSRIALKRIYLQHDTDVRTLFRFSTRTKPIYIRCSILNLNDNLVNGKKSDMLAIVCPEFRSRRDFCGKPTNNSFKLVKADTKICMTLSNVDGTPVDNRNKFRVIYELEFC